MQKTKTKMKTALCLAYFFPQIALAQFVEEERNTPSEFSLEGLATFNTIIDAVNIFLALLFVSSVIGLVVAGIKFLIAGGGESTLQSARKTAIASTIGLVFSLLGYVIVNVIKYFLT